MVDKAEQKGNTASAEAKTALNQGIKSAQAGDRSEARTSLLRATELDPRNENAWLWLASISEYPEELLGFLNHVLEINPENQRAREWKVATNALLSKTFVQRGIDASHDSQKDFAAECFQKALEYDDRNADAWMWMATLSESSTVKVSLLEKALEMEPENEAAMAELEVVRGNIERERLSEAKSAAVAGDRVEALRILDALLDLTPQSVEAWTMRSHLSESFDEKVRCFDHILAIDPDNLAAKASRDSLLSIFGTAHAPNPQGSPEEIEDPVLVEPVYAEQTSETSIDKSPTQELEMPSGFAQPTDTTHEETTDHSPEKVYENEKHETVAEPFASFAEETPIVIESSQDSDCGLTVAEVSGSDIHFADTENENVAFTSESDSDYAHSGYVEEVTPEVHWSNISSEPSITIPAEALPAAGTSDEPAVAATFVETAEVLNVKAESIECPFCSAINDGQVISCQSCMAVLTLSDLELLIANHNSDTTILRRAVEQMERQRLTRAFGPDELITLGLGHLNLRNLQLGYLCLQEASQLSPTNVVLGGQVNSLLIRLEEIKQQEEAHLKMPKGKSILVVDDSPTVRKLIAGKLEKSGHEVVLANDGVEAMERLENFVPDLVLLDITMPRMDGYQVCKQIRSNPATKDVTVVMISGKDGFFDKVRGRMAGTTGYITKPFGPETLMKAVEMYLSGEAPALDEA